MKIDLEQMNRRVKDGLVRTQKKGDLTIYTYSTACQFGREWDNYTRKSRGMILDREGNVVCHTFDKFFNLNEMPETREDVIPESGEVLYEKLDGSLLQMFYHDGRWQFSTKGSFDNIYTKYAQQLMDEGRYDHVFRETESVAFEIVLPPQLDTMPRAVPHEPGIYFLAAFHNFRHEEVPYEIARTKWNGPAAKRFSSLSLKDAMTLVKQSNDTEGWVVHYPDTGLRLKVKTDWFLRVFRVLSQINEKSIKELMAANPVDADWQKNVPEELLAEARRITFDIRTRMAQANKEIWDTHAIYKDLSRKEVALAIQDHPYKSFIFNMLDGKDYQAKLLEVI